MYMREKGSHVFSASLLSLTEKSEPDLELLAHSKSLQRMTVRQEKKPSTAIFLTHFIHPSLYIRFLLSLSASMMTPSSLS